MKISIENYDIECFETDYDLKNYLSDHRDDTHITSKIIYDGPLYGIPQDIKNLFIQNILVQIKRKNFTDVQSIIILNK